MPFVTRRRVFETSALTITATITIKFLFCLSSQFFLNYSRLHMVCQKYCVSCQSLMQLGMWIDSAVQCCRIRGWSLWTWREYWKNWLIWQVTGIIEVFLHSLISLVMTADKTCIRALPLKTAHVSTYFVCFFLHLYNSHNFLFWIVVHIGFGRDILNSVLLLRLFKTAVWGSCYLSWTWCLCFCLGALVLVLVLTGLVSKPWICNIKFSMVLGSDRQSEFNRHQNW